MVFFVNNQIFWNRKNITIPVYKVFLRKRLRKYGFSGIEKIVQSRFIRCLFVNAFVNANFLE